ncbi:hypothetical protein ADUPG1_010899 [Aduncisulcus paluster]|uniref:Uncharacterized protein n=1 Tax=Aduncisulcus paluster TaxID=2918883 RepID=A0ABQ5JXC2_9EUKA|nr:hypothetical protein ADUPG1_010899 [Aduncisulcus paluster]
MLISEGVLSSSTGSETLPSLLDTSDSDEYSLTDDISLKREDLDHRKPKDHHSVSPSRATLVSWQDFFPCALLIEYSHDYVDDQMVRVSISSKKKGRKPSKKCERLFATSNLVGRGPFLGYIPFYSNDESKKLCASMWASVVSLPADFAISHKYLSSLSLIVGHRALNCFKLWHKKSDDVMALGEDLPISPEPIVHPVDEEGDEDQDERFILDQEKMKTVFSFSSSLELPTLIPVRPSIRSISMKKGPWLGKTCPAYSVFRKVWIGIWSQPDEPIRTIHEEKSLNPHDLGLGGKDSPASLDGRKMDILE